MATVFDYKTNRPVNLTTSIPLLVEAGDYIFINGRPYDKSTLAPVPEGVALVPLYSARANVALVCTNTRYYSRYLGDGTAPAYRLPLPPSVTPVRAAADVGGFKWIGVPDELLTLVAVDGNFKANTVYTGSTTWGTYRLGMSRFIPAGSNVVTFGRDTGLRVDPGVTGPAAPYVGYKDGFSYSSSYYALYPPKYGFPVVLNSTLSPSTPSWLSYCFLHGVLGPAADGRLVVLTSSYGTRISSTNDGKAYTPTVFNTVLYNPAAGTYTVAASQATVVNTTPTFCLYSEPAVSPDGKKVYFTTSYGDDGTFGVATLTVDLANNTVSSPATCTVNLNGLVASLVGITNLGGAAGFTAPAYYLCANGAAMFTINKLLYLDYGTKKYLCYVPCVNYNSVVDYTASNLDTLTTLRYRTEGTKMYLFRIDSDTALTLVDVYQLPPDATGRTLPEAAFVLNGQKNMVIVGPKVLYIFAVDATNDKLSLVNTVSDEIHALGIDDLERIWCVYSATANDLRVDLTTMGMPAFIVTRFENQSYSYAGTDINSNLVVEVLDYANNRIAATVRLVLEGSVVFASDGSKVTTVQSQTDAAVQVPVIIKGSGLLRVAASLA